MPYHEFHIPYTYQNGSDDNLHYLTIDLIVEGVVAELIDGYENPPMNEEACREVAEELEDNYETFFEEELIEAVYSDDDEISTQEEFRTELENNNLRFIY